MGAQPILGKAFREHFHYPLGILFQFTTNVKIIGKTDDETASPHPRLDFLDKPFIQYIVEIDIRQHG
jgi:hypothetical protein